MYVPRWQTIADQKAAEEIPGTFTPAAFISKDALFLLAAMWTATSRSVAVKYFQGFQFPLFERGRSPGGQNGSLWTSFGLPAVPSNFKSLGPSLGSISTSICSPSISTIASFPSSYIVQRDILAMAVVGAMAESFFLQQKLTVFDCKENPHYRITYLYSA